MMIYIAAAMLLLLITIFPPRRYAAAAGVFVAMTGDVACYRGEECSLHHIGRERVV